MRVRLKLYAMLTDYLPPEAQATNALELDEAPDATVASLIERRNLPGKLVHLVLLNGAFVPPEERALRCLQEGDVLAIWPPIAGG